MQKGEVLIKAEGVSKKFCRNLKRSLWYGLNDITRSLLGIEPGVRLRKDEFWAVRDVSFEVRRGECLGLIGHNGAGKSTLLKMLNGLILPDEGRIEMRGKIGALIELGAGFNPLLTGRENVYNNGAVLGFRKDEMDQNFDDIVSFAELAEFIDMPVQNYSSGMKVRLGFAIAAQMEPDILIIDEVLAVGDIGFRIKCLNRIGELISKSAVIFVSHSMPQISRVCTFSILLHNGRIKMPSTDVSVIIAEYYKSFSSESEKIFGGDNIKLKKFTVKGNDKSLSNNDVIDQGVYFKIYAELAIIRKVDAVTVKIFFVNNDMRIVLDVPSELENKSFHVQNGELSFGVELPGLFLNGGNYALTLVVLDANSNERLYRHDTVFHITIKSKYLSWGDVVLPASWSTLKELK
jgi:lipopolysaccharide transport system ATP-binding protein